MAEKKKILTESQLQIPTADSNGMFSNSKPTIEECIQMS